MTDAQITLIINQGLHEIAVADDWPWLESETDISLVDSQQAYTIASEASDFLRAMAIIDDDNDETIPFIAPTTYFALVGNDTGNEASTPDFWTVWNDKIYFTPIPSASDSARVTFLYYSTATELSAGSDTAAFAENFHWILVEYAKWKLYEREEYYDQAERAKVTYLQYLRDMMAWYSRTADRLPYIVGEGRTRYRGDPNIPALRYP